MVKRDDVTSNLGKPYTLLNKPKHSETQPIIAKSHYRMHLDLVLCLIIFKQMDLLP